MNLIAGENLRVRISDTISSNKKFPLDVLKLMQDFLSGSPITQANYEVISIHFNNADILEKEQIHKTLPNPKLKLSRQVDFHCITYSVLILSLIHI